MNTATDPIALTTVDVVGGMVASEVPVLVICAKLDDATGVALKAKFTSRFNKTRNYV